jgi:putative sigma-54 modulation protein
MKYIFFGKNVEVSNKLKDRLMKKVGKLEKFFNPDTEATVRFSKIKSQQILELTIMQNGILFRAEERSDDMFASIDKTIDVIERQIRKNKTRLARRIHENAFKSMDADDVAEAVEENEFHIERVKKFQIKPMTADEAILQMTLLGHEFFVFFNSDSKQVNVVYKRHEGNYGLLEPEY